MPAVRIDNWFPLKSSDLVSRRSRALGKRMSAKKSKKIIIYNTYTYKQYICLYVWLYEEGERISVALIVALVTIHISEAYIRLFSHLWNTCASVCAATISRIHPLCLSVCLNMYVRVSWCLYIQCWGAIHVQQAFDVRSNSCHIHSYVHTLTQTQHFHSSTVLCKQQPKRKRDKVLTPSSPCLRKRRPAPKWCPFLKGLVWDLAWGRSLTARAAHRRSCRWSCSRQRSLSTCIGSQVHSRWQEPRASGPLTAHTPAGYCNHQTSGTCGAEGRQSQAYTARHRSAYVCTTVRVRACQCACVLISRNSHVSRARTPRRS